MRSGCDMKSVMRSSILRGSRTKVGNVTFERSMPTLEMEERFLARAWWNEDEASRPKLGYQRGYDGALVLISAFVVSVCVTHERGGEVEDMNGCGGRMI